MAKDEDVAQIKNDVEKITQLLSKAFNFIEDNSKRNIECISAIVEMGKVVKELEKHYTKGR